MLSMQLLLVIILCAVAFVAPLQHCVEIIAVLFLVGSFLAATHDMAIDGYYMEALDNEGQSKFVYAHWCGDADVEKQIKEETGGVTIRNIPVDQPEEPGECIRTGRPSKQRVLFARAY